MRLESSHILADADITKVVVSIIAVVVWGIGSLASMVKKANEEARRKAVLRGPVTPVSTDQRMAVGAFPSNAARIPPPLSASVLQKAQALAKKRQAAKAVPRPGPPPVRPNPPRAPAQAASSRPVVEKVVSTSASNIARASLAGAKAPAIRRWLVPSTLRKQFILTELLRPPVALRESE